MSDGEAKLQLLSDAEFGELEAQIKAAAEESSARAARDSYVALGLSHLLERSICAATLQQSRIRAAYN
jgi:hypothetical protein